MLFLLIIILFWMFLFLLSESGAFCWWGRCNGVWPYNNESSSRLFYLEYYWLYFDYPMGM